MFVEANLASVTAAAAGAAKAMPDDFRVSITNAPGKDAYPISSFTWLLIPDKIADAAKKKAIMDFLHWMLTDGQKHDRSSRLRAAAETGGGERTEGDREDSIAYTWRHAQPHPTVKRPPFGAGTSFLQAPARGRRDRLRSHAACAR